MKNWRQAVFISALVGVGFIVEAAYLLHRGLTTNYWLMFVGWDAYSGRAAVMKQLWVHFACGIVSLAIAAIIWRWKSGKPDGD